MSSDSKWKIIGQGFSRKLLKRSDSGFIVAATAVFVLLGLLLLYGELSRRTVKSRIEQLQSTRASHFYSTTLSLNLGQEISPIELRHLIDEQGFQESKSTEALRPGDFNWKKNGSAIEVTLFRPESAVPGMTNSRLLASLTLSQNDKVWKLTDLKDADQNRPLEKLDWLPKKIASYYAGRVRTHAPVPLSEMPVNIRHAVMAIEDVHFLEHTGVSFRAIFRALYQDLRARKFVQGGSTITQQLMKNLFFSKEKSLFRKIKEALYALITETLFTKEQILEAYLNEVYMGQWSTHEIHGVASGARYYFNRSLSQLTLAQSATLAAIVQAPNALDPRKGLQSTLKRRNLVLQKMKEAEFILPDEYTAAINEPVGVTSAESSLEDVGYFMDLAIKKMPPAFLSKLDTDALTIHVTIDPYLQASAAQSLRDHLDRLLKDHPPIRKKQSRGIQLQSALIAISTQNCGVLALQGGRSYAQTQFNRVLNGKRQPGSLFKPFVVLAALANEKLDPPITPISKIEGTPFEWKYEGQSWKPRNYEKEFEETVTVRKLLENSINVPTARLAQLTGLDSVIDTLRAAGIVSELPKVPSISLGSAESTPLELAEAYTTLAREGSHCTLEPIAEIYDEMGRMVYQAKPNAADALPAIASYQTVSLLKGVLTQGTARWASQSGLDVSHLAGKTGTTNDFKDAWFVGFSPQLLALVWVGYDEEEKVGLTGASASLPLWIDFMKKASRYVGTEDFPKPKDLVEAELDKANFDLAQPMCPEKILEAFRPGTKPQSLCSRHR